MTNKVQKLRLHSTSKPDCTSSEKRNRETVRTVSDGYVQFSKLCAAHGFDYFLLTSNFDRSGSFSATDVAFASLPSYATEHFYQSAGGRPWPLLTRLQTRSTLTRYKIVPTAASHRAAQGSPKLDTFLYDSLGVVEAIAVPLASFGQQRPLALYFRKSPASQEIDEAAITFESQLIFEDLEDLLNARAVSALPFLNARQLECLQWASMGKTSSEIGTIVSLSEHTVNHYLNSCCRALNCVNRTQAVAQAMRMGLID